ncbi:MAG: protein kinase [Oscillochloris sp.]|nr:protein kinase [Oscillochloris sp.]
MADAPVTPTAAPLLFDRYRVQEMLGETRLASVYAAIDERLHRQVLMHLLRKELVGQERSHTRFISEIGQNARRSHQALLEVFDSGEAAARPFMITEYVGGRPLRGLGVLTVEQALLYMRQVAGAVAVCQAHTEAHAPAGLYHPPISSSNVLLVDEGRVKLVDSWQIPLGDMLADLAYYRAPELSEGQPATTASAVYSLGLLLYELVTGVRPISGADARAIALAHLNTRIPSLAQARPNLYLPMAEQVLSRATARFPEQRYANAAALSAALDGLWRDLGSSTQRLVVPSVRRAASASASTPTPTSTPQLPEQPDDPQPVAPAPKPRSGAGGFTGFNITERLRRQPAPSSSMDTLRKRNLARGVLGWVVMVGLLLIVVTGSYLGVSTLIRQFSGVSMPDLPSLPGLPSIDTGESPFAWLGELFGNDEVYMVNLAEGLNLRSQPDVNDSTNILTVVANGTPVTKLEGPVVKDNIPWLRVKVESSGKQYEGWMSLNYLRQEQ